MVSRGIKEVISANTIDPLQTGIHLSMSDFQVHTSFDHDINISQTSPLAIKTYMSNKKNVGLQTH